MKSTGSLHLEIHFTLVVCAVKFGAYRLIQSYCLLSLLCLLIFCVLIILINALTSPFGGHKYDDVRCAQFGSWARREEAHPKVM